MCKKFLSLLTALCLMLSLAPAAFAAEESGRGEPTEIPTVSIDDMVPTTTTPMPMAAATGIEGTGTVNDPYIVSNGAEMVQLAQMFDQYIGERFIKLNGNIDLTNYASQWTEWGGLFTYFHGSIDGNGYTISGVPENCYLIYAWHDGTIKNLTFDLKGTAATLVYMSFSVQSSSGTVNYGHSTMDNVKVVSDETVVLTGNDQANYAPFVFSASPYFTMQNCKNYADISGNTYASVFYGYYPLPLDGYPEDADIQIINCENHGNVAMRYAGLVFGNPSGMGEDRNVTITGLKNYGEIRGTETAHYFCSDAGNSSLYGDGTYFAEKEAALTAGGNMVLTCADPDCSHCGSTGSLCVGNELTGFGLSLNENDKSFTITAPDNAGEVSYYTVTAYAYVNIFTDDTLEPIGTTRISLSDRLSGDNLTTSTVRAYSLKDGGEKPDNALELDISRALYLVAGNEPYYWLDNSQTIEFNCKPYINRDRTPGCVDMTVYAAAYNADGMLLDTVQYEV